MAGTITNVVNGKANIALRMVEDGSGVAGMSPTVEIRRLSDGKYFDWDASAAPFWKTSGGSRETRLLERSWLAGLYTKTWDQSLFDPDSIQTYATIARNTAPGYEIELVEYHSFIIDWAEGATSILEAPVYSSVHVSGSLAAVIAHTKGLANGEHFLDQTTYSVYEKQPLLLSGRMRIYSNPASVGTDNDVIATFRITSTWNNNQLQTYKVESE